MKGFVVTIQGVPPGLLQHRNTEVLPGKPPADAIKATPTIEEEAEKAAYRLESGELYQPAEHIYQSLVKAGSAYQVPGRGKLTYKDTMKGAVLVLPECIPHGTKDYEIDVRPVRIGKARVPRARPLLREWELSFTIQLLEDGVPDETMHAILVKAGQTVGRGRAWRGSDERIR